MAFAEARRAIEAQFPDEKKAAEIIRAIETPLSIRELGDRELANLIANASRIIARANTTDSGLTFMDPYDVIDYLDDTGEGPDRWILAPTQGWISDETSDTVRREMDRELRGIIKKLLTEAKKNVA